MKNINILSLLSIIIVVIIGVTSCGKDDNPVTDNSPVAIHARPATSTELDSLSSAFIGFRNTIEYKEYDYAIKVFVAQFDFSAEPLLVNRGEFEMWISTNLSLTRFVDEEEALNMYDAVLTAAENYHSISGPFYEMIHDLDINDIIIILQPELHQPPTGTAYNECQEDCMDEVDSDWEFIEENYAQTIQNANGDFGELFSAKFYHEKDVAFIINKFNDCMGGC